MKVSVVKADGYRLLNDFSMDLRDELSLVIGRNNTGKTSLLNLMVAFLSQGNTSFVYEDFSLKIQKQLLDSLKKPELDLIVDLPAISLEIEIVYDEKDNLRHLSKLMVDLSPTSRTVNLRFQRKLTEEGYRKIYADLQSHLDAFSKVKDFQGRPRNEEIRKFLSKRVGSYLERTIVSYDPKDKLIFLDLSKDFPLVKRVLNFEYLSAKRAVENKPAGKSGRSAGRALSQLSSEYFAGHHGVNQESPEFFELSAQAAVADHSLTAAYEKVFKNIIEKVKRFGGSSAINEEIRIMSELKPEHLLGTNTSVRYGSADTPLPEDHNGLGYLNLIAIIIEVEIRLLRLLDEKNKTTADISLLFIEEPEAHTHPQLQYIFIKQIKKLIREHAEKYELDLQTILTTHSPYITAESDFSDIKYFRKIGDRVEARNMTDLKEKYESDSDEYHFLTQYLTLTRAELFFADKAILIEGDTERILMRAMIRNLDEEDPNDATSLGSQNISIVEVGAHSHIFEHFIEFTGIKTLIITDIDSGRSIESKKDKEKSIYKLHACAAAEGTHTMNHTLKKFFNLTDSGIGDKGDLSQLQGKKSDDKVLVKKKQTWSPSVEEGNLRIAYQTLEKEYAAASFEDAFIHLNREFLKSKKEKFNGLKNRRFFDDETKDAYDLAQCCIKKKTHFALDVIFIGGVGAEAQWETPAYIVEGLRWLRDMK